MTHSATRCFPSWKREGSFLLPCHLCPTRLGGRGCCDPCRIFVKSLAFLSQQSCQADVLLKCAGALRVLLIAVASFSDCCIDLSVRYLSHSPALSGNQGLRLFCLIPKGSQLYSSHLSTEYFSGLPFCLRRSHYVSLDVWSTLGKPSQP